MSIPKPSEWFIGALEFFGVLIPGGVAVYLVHSVAISAGWIPGLAGLGGVAGWVAFLVISFIVGYLAHPPAHVFNRAYDRWYAEPRRRGGDPDMEFTRGKAQGKKGPHDSLYSWAKSELATLSKDQLARVESIEGVSKMFRTLTLLSCIAALVSFAALAWSVGIGLIVLALISFLVFAERRYAATKELYQSYRRAAEQQSPTSIITAPQ
jgi:hypothetical protein